MSKRNDISILLEKGKIIHNDNFDYSLITNYVNMHQKQKIICKKHNVIIDISLHSHITKKRGCKQCAIDNKTDNTNIFIEKSKLIHDDKYDYTLVDYINSKVKVKIICLIHGVFEQKPNDHLSGNGCPICKLSKGEIIIKNYLKLKNIKYTVQKKFKNCKYKYLLKFDFYLPDYNMCIEYDGEQHNKIIKFYGGLNGFMERILRDNIKNEYCKNNNIKLIRFNLTNIKDIEKIINDILK